NAGHQPPLLFTDNAVQELSIGGTVIGPLPEARFRRGFARLDPGAGLVLTSGGILERRGPKGEVFGVDRLKRVVGKHRHAPANEILERLFAASQEHGDGRPWEDDATAMVVRRVPAGKSEGSG